MKILFPLILSLAITGCAVPPQWLADMHDRNDPCQSRAELGRPENYKIPNWCGAAAGKKYIYNTSNQRVGYIK